MEGEVAEQPTKTYVKGSRAGYLRNWRNKKREEKEEKKKESDGDWVEFQNHVRTVALTKDAPAAVMGIYKEMLKLSKEMKKGQVMGADELARRNIEAENQLRKEGYIDRTESS